MCFRMCDVFADIRPPSAVAVCLAVRAAGQICPHLAHRRAVFHLGVYADALVHLASWAFCDKYITCATPMLFIHLKVPQQYPGRRLLSVHIPHTSIGLSLTYHNSTPSSPFATALFHCPSASSSVVPSPSRLQLSCLVPFRLVSSCLVPSRPSALRF